MIDTFLRSLKRAKTLLEKFEPKKPEFISKTSAKCIVRLEGKTPKDVKPNQEISENYAS